MSLLSFSAHLRSGAARALAVSALVLAGALGVSVSAAQAKTVAVYKVVTIGLVDDAIKGFEDQVKAKFSDVKFTEYDAQGQANLFPTIARQVVADKPDLIAVIGTPVVLATVQAAQLANSTVPIVFIAMGDPVGAGIADSLAAPGKQATGTTDWIPPEQTLGALLQAVPTAHKIGNIWDPSNQNGKVFHDALAKAVTDKGLTMVDVSIGSPGEVFASARSLVGRADVIVLGPDSAVIQGLPAIGGVALENKLPLIITAGDMTPGVLLSLGVDYKRLGALAGDAAAKVLGGTPVGAVPIVGPDGVAVTVNAETAGKIGVTLPASLGK